MGTDGGPTKELLAKKYRGYIICFVFSLGKLRVFWWMPTGKKSLMEIFLWFLFLFFSAKVVVCIGIQGATSHLNVAVEVFFPRNVPEILGEEILLFEKKRKSGSLIRPN